MALVLPQKRVAQSQVCASGEGFLHQRGHCDAFPAPLLSVPVAFSTTITSSTREPVPASKFAFKNVLQCMVTDANADPAAAKRRREASRSFLPLICPDPSCAPFPGPAVPKKPLLESSPHVS